MKQKPALKPKTSPLPFGVVASDLDYPSYPKNPKKADYDRLKIVHHIDLYEVVNAGWVVATLKISNGSWRRESAAARTYAVDKDGKVWRVGKGPHVLRVVTVHVTKARLGALKTLVDLHHDGAVKANTIRDRISSRRAQGALHRANGRTSWMWD